MASNSSGSGGAQRRGRPRTLCLEQVEVLLEIVRDTPLPALEDVVHAIWPASGMTISAATVRTYLREVGFERVLPPRTVEAGDERSPPPPSERASAPRCRRRQDRARVRVQMGRPWNGPSTR